MIDIRRLPPSRWKEYRSLRLDALKLNPLAFGSSFEEETLKGAGEWKKRIRNVDFALVDGLPVGMIVCSFNTERKFRHVAEIFGFYVRENFRGQGIGAALLEHALRKAKDRKHIVKVRLYVNYRQSAARKLYEREGFEVVGKLRREMKVNGRFYTMLVMERRIR